MTFVEKCGELLYKFLSNLMEILYFFISVFGKTLEYAIIGNIDTREKYLYLSIPESIVKYRYFSHHYSLALLIFPSSEKNLKNLTPISVILQFCNLYFLRIKALTRFA